jgi:4-amino-4-deoxy-L-arabinose transferase-like glycosyltransferase
VLLYSEAMYALTIALVLLASAAYAGDRSMRNAAFLGATVALAALARAEALLLVVLLIVPLVVWAGGPWRDRSRRLVVAVGVSAVVLFPWIARNALTFSRHPVSISNGAGYVLEISNCDQSYGIDPFDGKQLGYWDAACDRTEWVPGDESETAAVKQRTGLGYIADHRGRFPVVLAARVGRIWDIWRPLQNRDLNDYFEGRGLVPSTAALIMYYPLVVAAGAGLVVLRRRRQPLSPYVAIAVMSTLTAAVSFGITRYRVGADVALVLLAGVALDALVRRRHHRVGPEGTGPAAREPVTSGSPA